ncbi:hypothetical protein KQX54_007878 [Cotesia glomerata]|uniref:Uncharacterized protein n=1 Tax=Cotesia glomerata TaxID=32391 RepID=A0AAV7I1C5_COTGL|nr:hypothetical protein KQX54_007878 [Cotesia glomerata]
MPRCRRRQTSRHPPGPPWNDIDRSPNAAAAMRRCHPNGQQPSTLLAIEKMLLLRLVLPLHVWEFEQVPVREAKCL